MDCKYSKIRFLIFFVIFTSLISKASAFCGILIPDPSCPMGTFGYTAQQNQNAVEAAAADPRNFNDPSSPYYRVKQCEARRRNPFCQLGLCVTAAYLNCENANRNKP